MPKHWLSYLSYTWKVARQNFVMERLGELSI
jgi:hypothetical protein